LTHRCNWCDKKLWSPEKNHPKKWTRFPPELLQQVEGIFAEGFKRNLPVSAKINADGRIYSDELLFRVGFRVTGELAQKNFEVSLDFDPKKENALKKIHLAIDCAASVMEEYFSSDSPHPWDDLPKIWQDIQIQNQTVYIQVSSANPELEAEADKILASGGGLPAVDDVLVQGEDPDTDREGLLQVLGLKEDESADAADLDEDGKPIIKH
jgi:hypothetical protein